MSFELAWIVEGFPPCGARGLLRRDLRAVCHAPIAVDVQYRLLVIRADPATSQRQHRAHERALRHR